jgi:hypothetical protein
VHVQKSGAVSEEKDDLTGRVYRSLGKSEWERVKALALFN